MTVAPAERRERIGRKSVRNPRQRHASEETAAFAIYHVGVLKRGRAWKWSVLTCSGEPVLEGREQSRAAARYWAARALFLLLSIPRSVRED